MDDGGDRGAPPPGPDEDPSELGFTGYAGLAIVSAETAEYRELARHLVVARVSAAEAANPALARELLATLADVPETFAERIARGRATVGDVADKPVLAAMDEGAFVSALLEVHPAAQRKVMRAIGARYRHGSLMSVLAG